MTGSAVVVGGGVAGIAAAAALRSAGWAVTVVDRTSAANRGMPQDRQLHNLLTCAQVHLDRLLPGFCEELRRAGAGSARVADQTHVFELDVRMPCRDLGMRLMCAPRPVIERVARGMLLRDRDVTLLDGVHALSVELAGGSVAEIRAYADGDGSTKPRSFTADLVVDATGPRAAGRRWLRALGCEQPKAETLAVDRWYVSVELRRPPERVDQGDAWMVFPSAPCTRGGLVSPLGSDRWCVSLSGGASDEPPRTHAEMCAYAESLDEPWIRDVLVVGRPVGPPHLFRKRVSVWWRYDLIERPLPGLLPIGDAFASLNPLFGQGVSVAARQAAVLADLLAVRATTAELTRAYLAGAASVCAQAWSLGGLVDAPDPSALGSALQEDAELHRRYVAAWHLMEPASAVRLVSKVAV